MAVEEGTAVEKGGAGANVAVVVRMVVVVVVGAVDDH